MSLFQARPGNALKSPASKNERSTVQQPEVDTTESPSRWEIRWDLLLRYRLIEIIALWEGRLTTTHLCDTFGIGRQQASKDINNYIREIGPGNIVYDKKLKGYAPTDAFLPHVTSGQADEYLHLLNRNTELSNTFESLRLQVANTEVLGVPIRNVRPEILRPIVTAARSQSRIEVDYVSVHNPDREGRIIVPHTMVYTGLRWHVRAWCEKNQDYRDFVLSRFRDEVEVLDTSVQGAAGDVAWNATVVLNLVADPRLTPEQREVVEEDYGMQSGSLKITTRACLAHYVLQQLRIDPVRSGSLPPESTQIVLTNMEEVKPWLF